MNRIVTIAAAVLPLACLVGSCNTTTPPPVAPAATPEAGPAKGSAAVAPAPTSSAAAEPLARDTPKATTEGNTFVAPAGWSIVVRGPATILEPPEGNSAIALVDVHGPSADAAVAAAWQAYKPDAGWPLKVVNQKPDKDGWTDRSEYVYQTSPNEKRDVGADVQRAGDVWTVAIYDMTQAVGEKRLAQVVLV